MTKVSIHLHFGGAHLLAVPAFARAGGACNHSRVKGFPFSGHILRRILLRSDIDRAVALNSMLPERVHDLV